VTATAILLRPCSAALSRRIAAALGLGFFLVLLMARAATQPLLSAPEDSAANPGSASEGRESELSARSVDAQAPERRIALRPDIPVAGLTARDLFGAGGAASLSHWVRYLRARPELRITITLTPADAADEGQSARMAAAVLRLLAEDGIDPHRMRVALQRASGEPGGGATTQPGEISIEASAQ
jgi:type IV pilus biogenesis protein CpaD/CtpE